MSRNPYSDLPGRVEIVEVAPRDGWQNLSIFIPTDIKIALIEDLADCGFAEIEVGSFVNPRAIPQLRDAAEVLAAVKRRPGLVASVLVPNRRGLDAALAAGAEKLVFFISASETHNQRNLGCSQADSLAGIAAMNAVVGRQVPCRVSISNVFGCPFEGRISFDRVSHLVAQLHGLGLVEITLCDTLGVATPPQVYEFCVRLREALPEVVFGLHLHDSCGRALACVMAGLQSGIVRYDSAAGGLGGCPFAPGAAGNLATEDLVFCLENMGIATPVASAKLLAVVRRQRQEIGIGSGRMLIFADGCAGH
ncbi:MAG: hydroxymethylglutaryl-CoA lyase [Deltaproteobacteria bacterium]|nr:hydroxymethylglutaryl-CoA lyase [Deltaproteobacteria bacterium]